MKRLLMAFLNEEDGFQVFEMGILVKGSIILATMSITATIAILATQYTKAENEFIGNEAEAYEALERFTN